MKAKTAQWRRDDFQRYANVLHGGNIKKALAYKAAQTGKVIVLRESKK